MAQDYGILITQPGVDVSNPKAGQVLLNTAHPFIKIDTQNPAGFQTMLLLITNDPPQPPLGSTNYTTVAKFKHGYTYVPTVETLFYVVTPPTGTGYYMNYFQDSGVIAQASPGDIVTLYASADATYVYYIVKRQTLQSNILLSGATIQISSHVFVEDVGV